MSATAANLSTPSVDAVTATPVPSDVVPAAPTFEAAVFDFDGTMVDTETAEYEAARLVYADYGLDLAPDAWIEAAGTMWGASWVDDLHVATAGVADAHEARRRKREYIRELHATTVAASGTHRAARRDPRRRDPDGDRVELGV